MARAIVAVPRDMCAKKPAHGSPCNNCGLCCWSSKCDVGRKLFGGSPPNDGPCPALRFDSEQNSYCNVIAKPEEYRPDDPEKARDAMKLLMYAGWGCTMRINGEFNHDFNARLDFYTNKNQAAFDDALHFWGIEIF